MYIIINIIANIAKLSNSICQLVIILAKQNKIFINLDFQKKQNINIFRLYCSVQLNVKLPKTAFLFLIYQ